MKESKNAVLIVDDDADDRQIIQDAFLECNFGNGCVMLENGDKLIEYLHSSVDSLPSLIMLDLNMPGKDGRAALKEIKSDRVFQHIPIIVFTTSSGQKDRDICYEFGANCFITKPNSYNKLVGIVDSIAKLWIGGVV
jgi:two-component system response regulator